MPKRSDRRSWNSFGARAAATCWSGVEREGSANWVRHQRPSLHLKILALFPLHILTSGRHSFWWGMGNEERILLPFLVGKAQHQAERRLAADCSCRLHGL